MDGRDRNKIHYRKIISREIPHAHAYKGMHAHTPVHTERIS
jgi:hypothetical protein